MKKILFLAIMFATAIGLVSSCKPEPIEENTFNQLILKDYKYLTENFDEVSFREVQVEFNCAIDTTSRDSLKIVDMTTVAQVGFNVYFLNRSGLDQTEPTLNIVHNDIWVGSDDFDPTKQVKITLEEAINLVLDSLETIPNSRFVTLRLPVTKYFYENPFYIFGGSHTGYVSVDALTGELNKMK